MRSSASSRPAEVVTVTELEIVRIADGRIVELRELADLGSLMAQLGTA